MTPECGERSTITNRRNEAPPWLQCTAFQQHFYQIHPEAKLHEQVSKLTGLILSAPRGSDPHYLPHHQSKIESTNMDQHPLADVLTAAQMYPTHASGFIGVGETSFQQLAAPPQ